MKGIIVAANRTLGVFVVETDNQQCVVLETTSHLPLSIGEELDGDWDAAGHIIVHHPSSDETFNVRVRQTEGSRHDAIGSVAVI
jgi:hypothetical protein